MCLRVISLFTIVMFAFKVHSHPTGNLIVVNDYVLWSYINPVQDKDHHACIMIWKEGTEPRPLITSKFPASDFMAYAKSRTVYLIERKYIQENDTFEARVLKGSLDGEFEEIWPWFKDEWRIGEGGFAMPSDDEIVFCSYPDILRLKKGKAPKPFLEFGREVKRARFLTDGNILLLADDRCWLTDDQGNVFKEWKNLIDENVDEPPLGRNQIFDVDYSDGKLLVAYWGKRCFYSIDENGNREIVWQLDDPDTPHWVAFRGNERLLFASKLIFDGSMPRPRLVSVNDKETKPVWITD
ncbi:hypothetical protein ACEZ3G_03360 [Maribacter algicola]|uniref:Uncharacterized protein n=1 Tax=Meishania litoralis TaxID=3434685 RepID=A0ACC7LHM3_9FLAO